MLIKVPKSDIELITKEQQISPEKFKEHFLVDLQDADEVGILHVVYSNSIYSKPPDDGKLRKLRPDYQWLNVRNQLLIPIDSPETYPVPYRTIYTSD